MNAPVRDLYRRQACKDSGKNRYYEARSGGFTRAGAARYAGIAYDYACTLDRELTSQPSIVIPDEANEGAHVAALIAAGGYSRLSEKMTRQGHVVCLPLVPFEARP